MRMQYLPQAVGIMIALEHQIHSKTEQNEAMSDIPKHHPKQEGESDSSEERRVGLLVLCNSIGLDNLLGWTSVVIDHKVSGKTFALFLEDLSGGHITVCPAASKSRWKGFDVVISEIDIAFDKMVVQSHLVESVMDISFLEDVHHVVVDAMELETREDS